MLGQILIVGVVSCAWALRVPSLEPTPEEGARAKRAGDTRVYEALEGHGFYKYHDYGASWCMAEEICREEGAHLMVINNERESELLRAFFNRYPKTRGDPRSSGWAWVGLRERGTNNHYLSVLGESLDQTGFYEWYPGYPVLSGPNDCVVAGRETGTLADDDCERHYSFICESDTDPGVL